MNQPANITVAPATPREISSHSMEQITIHPMTAKDHLAIYGAAAFDYTSLKKEFAKICTDFDKKPNPEEGSFALSFASEVIYKIGPEARRLNKVSGDKAWRLAIDKGYIFIGTFKNGKPPGESPVVKNNTLLLTTRQAGLIAIAVMSSWSRVLYNVNKTIVFTPLAGAIFSRDDKEELTRVILSKTGELTDDDYADTMAIINASCQPGGFYSPMSDLSVAKAAAYTATSNCKEALKKSILDKLGKQYTLKSKTFNESKFKKLLRLANGGVPSDISYDKLNAVYNNEKERRKYENYEKARAQNTATTSAGAIGGTETSDFRL